LPSSDRNFYLEPFQFAGKSVRGRLVIPSGIRCIHASVIAKCFAELDSVGIVTTKSVSVAPRQGYREPIYARYSHGSYINAVGLSNPGAEAFCAELKSISVPANKALLVSIFGGNAADFAKASTILKPVADAFELNMSCPHAAGYGIELGHDIDLVKEITAAVVRASGLPVMVKLSGMLPRLALTAKAAIDAGAAGITVTNTVGPSIVAVGDEGPILSNRVGGLSGDAIRPVALRSAECVRSAIGPGPIVIGMGGIGTAEHVAQFRQAGADVFGIGSALTGLSSSAAVTFFSDLEKTLVAGKASTLGSSCADTALSMDYHRCTVTAKVHYSERLFKLTFDQLPASPAAGDLAGRFYFLCVPGVGEKPFAIFSADDRSVVIKTVGAFTNHLASLPVGSTVLIRGPYGRQFCGIEGCTHYILAGGGTGIASLPEIALFLSRQHTVQFVLGARSKSELFETERIRQIGPVSVATDDGSLGYRGTVSDLLSCMLAGGLQKDWNSVAFVNCGPEPMVYCCAQTERKYASAERIISAVEYYTSCGVGICGKCASPSGHLSCIDGPFMPFSAFVS
jgi:dihydroorotate dehydrogenase (NAD+) catalytic subunit